MLAKFSLKFTEIPNPLEIAADGVTIFVGPNNSGKSLILRELETAFSNNSKITTYLLNDFDIIWPNEAQVLKDIEMLAKKAPAESSPDRIYLGRYNPTGNLESTNVDRNNLINEFKSHTNKLWVSSHFLKFFLLRLDGRTRFSLTDDKPRGDLLAQKAQNMLGHYFIDNKLRENIRNIIFDALGVYFTIDALSQDNFRIRLSDTPPTENEQNFNEDAREFHRKALYIKNASDGVQAFVGIMCSVLSGDYRITLIDEPEAFLHPPLARKLGYQLTSKLKPEDSLMASTHSPDFLIGCLQASPKVRVVRLEYSNGKSRGKIIDTGVLNKFFQTPLIRSANVISGLFHDGVVVTESDNDRAFYSEVYYRLSEKEKGYPSILFINAQNKQTIRDIMGPLRTFGVPAAAIVDIDILKDGGKTWIGWLTEAQIPTTLHSGYGQQRGDLFKRFTDLGIDMKSQGGVSKLPKNEQAAANDFFDILDQYGVFAVRNGELESWLKAIKAVGKKTEWTISALEKMGSEPSKAGYVKPADDDVWKFMRSIVSWIQNPARKGLS